MLADQAFLYPRSILKDRNIPTVGAARHKAPVRGIYKKMQQCLGAVPNVTPQSLFVAAIRRLTPAKGSEAELNFGDIWVRCNGYSLYWV